MKLFEQAPCPVEGCNGKVNILNVNPYVPRRISLLTINKNVDMKAFYRDPIEQQTDALILGMKGSGKTSLLFFFLGYFWADAFSHEHCVCTSNYGKGATVVFRALKHNYEYLALLEAGAKLNLILPEGAEIRYSHPNLHLSYHELDDYHKVFESFRKDSVNILGTGQFLRKPDSSLIDTTLYYSWWLRFFDVYIAWKMEEALDERIIFFIDEMQDLVPGRSQRTVKTHRELGNNIRSNLDIFRRANTKLIATTHSLTQLDKAFRDSFPYWFIKKTKPESVPDEYYNYSRYIQRMDQNCVFVTDGRGMMNDRPSRIWVLTKSYSVKTRGVSVDTADREDSTDMNRARLAALVWNLRDKGFSMRDIADMARWGGPSRVHDICKTWPKRRVGKMLPKDEWPEKPDEGESSDEEEDDKMEEEIEVPA